MRGQSTINSRKKGKIGIYENLIMTRRTIKFKRWFDITIR